MILHGKAKEDFLEWYGTGENYFNMTLKEIEQHANIIEWLDGVGVYVLVDFWQNGKAWFSNIYHDGDESSCVNIRKESRREATIEAIKKANEIYNENLKTKQKK